MLDPVQQSLVTRWLPLAAVLSVAAIVVVRAHLRPEQRARYALGMGAPGAVLALAYGVALLAPGEGHFRVGVIYLLFVAVSTVYALAGLRLVVSSISDRRAALLLGLIVLAVFLALDPYHRAVQP